MEGENVPVWDMADRLRKALRVANLSTGQMAEYLGMTPGTVSRYVNGHQTPQTQTLRLWAIRTNVPYEWLVNG